jgi:uncharacterized protein
MVLALLLQGIQIPSPTGFVNDFAGVLSAESESRMTELIQGVRSSTGGEIAVVTISDLRGQVPADVALRIGREWKVGRAGAPGDLTRNTGMVVLIVPKETSSDRNGHCRIETATGSEVFVTDGTAGEMCRSAIPYFARQDYSGGTEYIVRTLAGLYRREFSSDTSAAPVATPTAPAPARARRGGGMGFVGLLAVFFVIVLLANVGRTASTASGQRRRRSGVDPLLFAVLSQVLSSGARTRKSRGGWSAGGWGGGGGGFRGGGFGGFGGGGGFRGGGGGASW